MQSPAPRFPKALFALLASLVAIAPSFASAQELTGVMKAIKERGYVTIGYRESSMPFSYLDAGAEPVGYSIDICRRAVDAIAKAIAEPNLGTRFQLVTPQNRILLVQNGTVDLECGSTVNLQERRAQVEFSPTTYVVAMSFIARKVDNVKTLQDLKGKTVAATTGTITLRRLRELNASRNLDLNILTGKDHSESMLLVTTGRAAAFFEDDILLRGFAASAVNPDELFLSAEGYSVDPYGIMLKKDDPQFKSFIDRTFTSIFQSGEINGIYERWFTKPIPPKGVNFDLPMSATLKKAIQSPTDSSDPAAYKL